MRGKIRESTAYMHVKYGEKYWEGQKLRHSAEYKLKKKHVAPPDSDVDSDSERDL